MAEGGSNGDEDSTASTFALGRGVLGSSDGCRDLAGNLVVAGPESDEGLPGLDVEL